MSSRPGTAPSRPPPGRPPPGRGSTKAPLDTGRRTATKAPLNTGRRTTQSGKAPALPISTPPAGRKSSSKPALNTGSRGTVRASSAKKEKVEDVDDKIAQLQKSLKIMMRTPVMAKTEVAKIQIADTFEEEQEKKKIAAEAEKLAKQRKPDTPELTKKRIQVLEEVISTESTYVKEMLSLMQNYLQPMIDKNIKGVKDPGTLKKFLGSAHQIAIMHAKMKTELLKGDADDGHVVRVLAEYVPFMKCYFPFIQTYPTLLEDFTDPSNKALVKFLTETAAKCGHQSISQLFILPVQRIPRYVLLLQEVDRFCPSNYPYLDELERCLQQVRIVATQVNDCNKESENSAKLFKYHTAITGIPDSWKVLSPSHLFLREGVCLRIAGKIAATPPKAHPAKGTVRLILFNDAVVVTEWNYKYLERIDVDALEPRPRDELMLDVLSGLYADELHEGHTYMFDTGTERNEWMSAFMMARNDKIRQIAKFKDRTAGASAAAAEEKESEENVEKLNVFMRIRPLIGKTENTDGKICLHASGKRVTLQQPGSKRADRISDYDHVFTPQSTQEEIFNVVGKETLGAIFAGYSIGIFAYGNTGAGKTYTMFGAMDDENNVTYQAPPTAELQQWRVGQECWAMFSDGHYYYAVIERQIGSQYEVNFPEYGEKAVVDATALVGGFAEGDGGETSAEGKEENGSSPNDADTRGLIPRILEWLFDVLNNGSYEKVEVKLSYLQVYNSEVHDLLQSDGKDLRDLPLKRMKNGNYKAENLTETGVTSCEEAMNLIRSGNLRRITRAHKMNEMSSRSHAIVTINASFATVGGKVTSSNIHLIDLAGSEAQAGEGSKDYLLDDVQKKYNAEERKRFLEESKFINQSLISLGRVVHTLIENQKRSAKAKKPVPFRENKLTHLLMDVLTGDFLCSLILNASPSPVNNQVVLSAKTIAFGEGIKKLSSGKKDSKTDKTGMWLTGVWNAVRK